VLSNIVKNKTGQTAKKLIEEMVLSHAKVLLKSGEYNVSEVATLLNYNNVEEFSRFFKRKTGATALKFCKE
jgi:AraC-like DNA-binding protein